MGKVRKTSFPITERWIQEELGDTPARRSMFQSAAEIYAEMQMAMASDGARDTLSVKAAGTFGGLAKSWRAGLVASLTKDIIQKVGMDVSRERIRAFQLDVFGRAQASKDLKNYAVKIRNGGGRAAPMPEVPEWLKDAAFQFFIDHQDDLKNEVQKRMRHSG